MYDKGDYTAIKKHLSNIGWDIILSGKCVQQQWDVLVDIIGSLEDQYIPSKIVEINRDDKFGEKLPNHIRLQIKKNITRGSATWKPGVPKYIAHFVGLETR